MFPRAPKMTTEATACVAAPGKEYRPGGLADHPVWNIASRPVRGVPGAALLRDAPLSCAGLRRDHPQRAAETAACMAQFNRWLTQHALTTTPPMALLDTTTESLDETVAKVERWLD